MKFAEMESGKSYNAVFLISSIEEKTAKNGATFVALNVLDGSVENVVRMFNTNKNTLALYGIVDGALANLTIDVSNYNGSKSYMLKQATRVEPTPELLSQFILMPPLPPATLFASIEGAVSRLETSETGTLKGLTLQLLRANKEAFIRSSAAKGVHHNLYGGLVYHTARMVQAAEGLTRTYPALDKELLVCGTALHDLGKILELDTTELGTASYSVPGRLLGHATIGIIMINNEASKGCYDPERILLLEHMIASHHGKQEWGAIQLPAIKEAAILNHIDMMDALMYQYEKMESATEPGTLTDSPMVMGQWTSYNPRGQSTHAPEM